MARSDRTTVDPTRKAAFASGLFYLITFASSIPAALLLAPILTDPTYIVGPGADSQVMLACLLDLINALTAFGSAVAVFSVIKRHHEGLALGFVTTRMFEAATIVIGIVSLLAVVSIRQAGPAAGADAGSLVAVGQGLVGVRDWTFIIGPSLMPGFNALMFATVLYRARLVPRWIPAMGLIGGPLLITSAAGVILGLHELGSLYSGIALVPIFFWELLIGLWMTFKGFDRRSPLLSPNAGDDADGGSPITTASAPVARPMGATSAATAAGTVPSARSTTFTRSMRLPRVPRLRRRHILLLVGLSLSMAASAQAQAHALGLVPVILFAIAVRAPLLLGIGQPKGPGRLARRVVPLFNAMHEPTLPLAIVGLGLAGILPAVLLVGGLAWLGQLVIDWALGDGRRAADGTLRPAPARWTSWPSLTRPVAGGARA